MTLKETAVHKNKVYCMDEIKQLAMCVCPQKKIKIKISEDKVQMFQ